MRKRNALVVALLAHSLLYVLLFPAGAASNKDKVFQELTGRGLNAAATCGVMANIDKESTFKPTATSRGGSYGLCQWTGSRKTDLFNYCKKNGLDSSTVEGQIAFLLYELQTSYKSVWNTLKSAPNTADGAYNAAYRFCYDFERPASKASRSSERANLARSTYWPAYKNVTILSGLVKGPDGKWAVYKNGTVDTSVTSIVKNQYGWWRVVNGYADFKANSIYKNQNGWYKCTGGKVTFDETGVYQNENGWWYCKNSKVDFNYNGPVEYNGIRYEVVNGRAGAVPGIPKAAAALKTPTVSK
ncbi:MAG: hypothetical protein ILO43_04205 [Clostridia bacterium]|nr:hypothetical protein [Clostridia bacterium]